MSIPPRRRDGESLDDRIDGHACGRFAELLEMVDALPEAVTELLLSSRKAPRYSRSSPLSHFVKYLGSLGEGLLRLARSLLMAL